LGELPEPHKACDAEGDYNGAVSIWNTPSGRDRRWKKRGGGSWRGQRHSERSFIRSARGIRFAQAIVILVAVVLLGRLVWQGVKYMRGTPVVTAPSK
jgi:hypothetical protein